MRQAVGLHHIAAAINVPAAVSIKKPATVEDFYISVGKGSKYVSLLPELNRKIERMAKDGTVESLIKKYTTQYEKALTAPPATK